MKTAAISQGGRGEPVPHYHGTFKTDGHHGDQGYVSNQSVKFLSYGGVAASLMIQMLAAWTKQTSSIDRVVWVWPFVLPYSRVDAQLGDAPASERK